MKKIMETSNSLRMEKLINTVRYVFFGMLFTFITATITWGQNNTLPSSGNVGIGTTTECFLQEK